MKNMNLGVKKDGGSKSKNQSIKEKIEGGLY